MLVLFLFSPALVNAGTLSPFSYSAGSYEAGVTTDYTFTYTTATADPNMIFRSLWGNTGGISLTEGEVPTVTIDGVSFTPSEYWWGGGTYHNAYIRMGISISAGSDIVIVFPNVVNGSAGTYSWTGKIFTADSGANAIDSPSSISSLTITPDTAPPTVSYLNPADNATAVGVDSTFEIAFNETIATSTGNIVLYKTSDDSTVETIDIAGSLVTASSTTALIINPSVTLESETEYYFTIPATGVDDASGNSYAGITASTTWSFTTADVASPIVSTLSPTDGATDIAIDSNLVITFDEIVDVESGNLTIKKSSDDSTVATIDITTGVVTGTGTTEITINPASDLEYNTSYYINIDATAFDDSSSNSYAGISNTTTWNFTTIADTPVVAVSSTSIAGTSTSRRVTNLLKMGSTELAQELMRQYPNLFINQATPQAIIPTSPTYPTSTLENGCKIGNINRTLRTGSEGEDVRELQTFLNCAGFPLALSGPGSVGNETIYFSTKTHNALVKFQESHVSDILTPLNLIRGTGIFGPSTRGFVNGL